MDRTSRKYVAVSIKHICQGYRTLLWFWGFKRTGDGEKRSFSGYTSHVENAELYSLDEFEEEYEFEWIDTSGNAHFTQKTPGAFLRKYRKYDTVLIEESEAVRLEEAIRSLKRWPEPAIKWVDW